MKENRIFSGKTRFGYLLPLFVGRSVQNLTAQFAAAEDCEGENRSAAHWACAEQTSDWGRGRCAIAWVRKKKQPTNTVHAKCQLTLNMTKYFSTVNIWGPDFLITMFYLWLALVKSRLLLLLHKVIWTVVCNGNSISEDIVFKYIPIKRRVLKNPAYF